MAEQLGRRRRFIACINRNLERVLHVNETDYSDADNIRQSAQDALDTTLEEQRERLVRRTQQLNEIRRLLLLVPRGIRTRLHNCEPLQRLREALREVRLDQLPGELLDQLNELNIF